MAGNKDTTWARYKTLIIFWGITFILILATLGIQFWEADLANQFSGIITTTIDNARITIAFPTRLFLPSINSPEQTLLIRISAPETDTYTIRLNSGDWIALYDTGGNAISPYWKGQGNNVFTALEKALPVQRESRQAVSVDFQINSISHQIPLGQITLESGGQSRWRIGLEIFARNIALPLGLLSAIFGWVASYIESEKGKAEKERERDREKAGKEKEKNENEFRDRLAKIPAELSKDIMSGLKYAQEINRFIRNSKLGKTEKTKLDAVLLPLLTRDVLKRLLGELGNLAEQRDEPQLLVSLKTVIEFYKEFSNTDFEQKTRLEFKTITAIYDFLKAEGKNSLAILESILLIWDDFDIFSASFVIYLLNKLYRVTSPDVIKKQVELTPHRRRLNRYKQLAWLGGEADKYEWPPFEPRPEHSHPDLQKWFEKTGIFSSNPFETVPLADPLLLKCNNLPQEWDLIKSANPGQIKANSSEDLIAAAFLLSDYLRNREGKAGYAFPIFFSIDEDYESSDFLESVVHRAAETWLEFLAYSPDAYLDMFPEERRSLAAWLAWHCGSIAIASIRLRQQLTLAGDNIKEKADVKLALEFEKNKVKILVSESEEKKVKFLQALESEKKETAVKLALEFEKKKAEAQLALDLFESCQALYSKEILPSSEQMLDWLRIRPFGVKDTFVITVAIQPVKPEIIHALEMYRQPFLVRNVILKRFEL